MKIKMKRRVVQIVERKMGGKEYLVKGKVMGEVEVVGVLDLHQMIKTEIINRKSQIC